MMQSLKHTAPMSDGSVGGPPAPDLFVREDVAKPENRVNLALFSLMLVPTLDAGSLEVSSLILRPTSILRETNLVGGLTSSLLLLTARYWHGSRLSSAGRTPLN
jgi:hypothetical protein